MTQQSVIYLVTYLYPSGVKYIESFKQTLLKQTVNDFKLIVFNDNVVNAKEYFKDVKQEVEFVDVEGDPTQIRFYSFNYLKKSNVDYIVFNDIDDQMSSNRIEKLVFLLSSYSFVCNELTLTNEAGEILVRNYWSKRLPGKFEFDAEFIRDKNILGIGNAAIRKSVLDFPLNYNGNPRIADWFIFYQLLHNSNSKALFTNECYTLYRQHNNNMAGIIKINSERFDYVLSVKRAHYKGLTELGFDVEEQLEKLEGIEDIAAQVFNKNKEYEEVLFWWEETNFIINKSNLSNNRE